MRQNGCGRRDAARRVATRLQKDTHPFVGDAVRNLLAARKMAHAMHAHSLHAHLGSPHDRPTAVLVAFFGSSVWGDFATLAKTAGRSPKRHACEPLDQAFGANRLPSCSCPHVAAPGAPCNACNRRCPWPPVSRPTPHSGYSSPLCGCGKCPPEASRSWSNRSGPPPCRCRWHNFRLIASLHASDPHINTITNDPEGT